MKTVLITGAGRGLGYALTQVFLQHGWQVFACVRDTATVPEDLVSDASATILPLDVTSETSIQTLAQSLRGQAIDVLINNAGIYDSGSVDNDAVDTSMSAVAKVFQTNTFGPALLAQALVPHLQAGEDKLIVSITSGMGTFARLLGKVKPPQARGGDAYNAEHWPYGASKAALNYAMIGFGITHKEIKSILVSPGWLKTAMGGKSATIDPAESAEHIFEIVENSERYESGAVINQFGKPLDL